jgi:hypothetical protein
MKLGTILPNIRGMMIFLGLKQHEKSLKIKGTVSLDCKDLEVILIKSLLLGHLTKDISRNLNTPFNF